MRWVANAERMVRYGKKNKNVKIWRIIKQKERRMAGSKILGGRMLREKVGSQRLRKKPETEDKEKRIAVA